MSIQSRLSTASVAVLVATTVTTIMAAPPGRPSAPPSPATIKAARPAAAHATNGADRQNILFVVIDDIGIDAASWQPFGWNAAPDAPFMPVMQAIADDAVSFTNFWATPECSPSRACFLTGRWGHQTGVTTAIVDPMLPANHLNPA